MSGEARYAPLGEDARERPIGESGAWIFIFGDMFIFTMLFATILYYRGQDPQSFFDSQLALSRILGLVNTLVLLTGSILIVRATHLALRVRERLAVPWLSAGAACGLCFIVIKGIEYATLIQHGHWIRSNPFFMLFFVITGAHLMHVLLGMCVLLTMRAAAAGGLRAPRDRALFESGACYWHMVDLIWLILFPLLYLVH